MNGHLQRLVYRRFKETQRSDVVEKSLSSYRFVRHQLQVPEVFAAYQRGERDGSTGVGVVGRKFHDTDILRQIG